jgi:hypothetical protein
MIVYVQQRRAVGRRISRLVSVAVAAGLWMGVTSGQAQAEPTADHAVTAEAQSERPACIIWS